MKIEIFFKIKVNKPSKFREIKEALHKRQLVPRTDWQDHIFSISHEIWSNLNIFSGICRNFISNCLLFSGEIVLVKMCCHVTGSEPIKFAFNEIRWDFVKTENEIVSAWLWFVKNFVTWLTFWQIRKQVFLTTELVSWCHLHNKKPGCMKVKRVYQNRRPKSPL